MGDIDSPCHGLAANDVPSKLAFSHQDDHQGGLVLIRFARPGHYCQKPAGQKVRRLIRTRGGKYGGRCTQNESALDGLGAIQKRGSVARFSWFSVAVIEVMNEWRGDRTISDFEFSERAVRQMA